jgi:IclR family acetate operon transcriptional repressor
MPKRQQEGIDSQPPTLQNKGERYFSKAIGHALNILEIFKQEAVPYSLSDITRKTRLPKSSVFRILRTLEVAGYIERSSGDRYAISPAMAAQVSNGLAHKLVRAALPFVQGLNREFRETVSVACLFENHIEVVLTVPSPEKIQMSNVLGGIIPPYASSLGKCIVAHQPESCRHRLLSTYGITPFTPKTITRELELNKEYEKVRKQGYSIDLEETAVGGCCFAAPIYYGDKVIAAISISVPKMRCQSQERFIKAVVSPAAAITSKLCSA